MPCKQDLNCKFYRAIYSSNFNNAVINPPGDKYTCDVLNWFKEEVSEGPARLTQTSLKELEKVKLECVVLKDLNKKLK